MLGDRLAVAKLLLEAMEREEITEDQAERWFDNLVLPASVPSEVSRSAPNATEPSYEDDLARVDAEERRDAENAADYQRTPLGGLSADIEEDLANQTPHPIQPVQPGQNLLDDPDTFKERVKLQQQRKLSEGTPHR